MLTYPQIDPVAIAIGPLKVHWYGLMYIIGIGVGWWLARLRAKKFGFTAQQVDDLVFYSALGVVLGGRVGYTLFYNLPRFLDDPSLIFRVWEGGMSFHGGFLGVFFAGLYFAHKNQRNIVDVWDFIIPSVPISLLCGRIGNFINGELYGKPTDVPWAMVFPGGGPLPRHPSQLYEGILEGIVIFIVIWLMTYGTRSKRAPRYAASGLFVLMYGFFRSLVELVRLPDAHIGYLAWGWVTQGQLLSLPMIVLGLVFLYLAYLRKQPAT
ncbi:MAG: prolipoprotein diacylglyceryl transferase [Gammaproteobacteria bacterium]|nr:prolipoprotein diacylglyceryl transferase [Gammaproteobacteria bacterium]